MFLGTVFIYLTFCLVAFLLTRSQINRDTLIYFQSSDLLLPVQVLLFIRGNAGCSLGPSPAPEMVSQVVQVTETLEPGRKTSKFLVGLRICL